MSASAGGLLSRHRHRVLQLVMLGLRLGNAGAKFALAVYMARYLGLADVGLFGLMVGAATGIPAIFGFGLNDWTGRHLVGMARAAAMPVAVTRLAATVVVQIVLQAVAWGLVALFHPPIATSTLALASAVLFLEHLAVDDYSLEIGRERPTFANVQLFLRAGLWPLPVIGWGLLDPAARSLDVVLGGWLAGLIAMWAVVAVRGLSGGRWRLIGFDGAYLRSALRGSVPFWLADMGTVGNLYLDRFILSAFMGLEATGVYTFFWSFANVAHTLAVNGIVQPQAPRLIAAERSGDPAAFAAERTRLVRDSIVWAGLLIAAIGVLLPLVLPWFGRPLLVANLPVFWAILTATAVRIGSDGLGFVLYALRCDRAIAVTSLLGVAATAAAGLTLVPSLGIGGAAVGCLVVAFGSFFLRRHLVGAALARRGWRGAAQ